MKVGGAADRGDMFSHSQMAVDYNTEVAGRVDDLAGEDRTGT